MINIVYKSSLKGILLGWCRCDGKTDHVFSPWGLHLHKWATRWCKPWCRLELELHPQAAPSIHQTCLFCMRLSRHVTAKFGYHGYLRTKVAFEFQMIYRMCSVQKLWNNNASTSHSPGAPRLSGGAVLDFHLQQRTDQRFCVLAETREKKGSHMEKRGTSEPKKETLPAGCSCSSNPCPVVGFIMEITESEPTILWMFSHIFPLKPLFGDFLASHVWLPKGNNFGMKMYWNRLKPCFFVQLPSQKNLKSLRNMHLSSSTPRLERSTLW